jgi:hypothetical protein
VRSTQLRTTYLGVTKVAGYPHTRQKSPIRLRASQRQKHSETHDFGWLHGSAHVVTLVERPQERPADTTPRRQQDDDDG